MPDNKRPGWGAFLPRFNIPETFGTAIAYEAQLHWFLENWDEVADYANALEQPTIKVGRTEFPDTSNALLPSITNSGTDINAVLDFTYPIIRTRFADPLQWDFDTAYDLLTVVSDGNGNSYTSRQAVPAHTPLTDTDYWVLTGVYDASLQAIREDVASVKDGYVRVYKTVADMQADTALLPGMVCRTLGFYSVGDGGSAWYVIGETASTGYDVLQLATNDTASIVPQPSMTARMLGLVGDGASNDIDPLQWLVDHADSIDLLGGSYMIGEGGTSHAGSSTLLERGLIITNTTTIRNGRLVLADAMPDMYTIVNSYGAYVRLENVELDGNYANQSGPHTGAQDGGMHGLRIRDGATAEVVSCHLHDFWSDCITSGGGTGLFVRDSAIDGGGRNGITANSSRTLVQGCTFTGNGVRTEPRTDIHREFDSGEHFSEFFVVRDCTFDSELSTSSITITEIRTSVIDHIDLILISGCVCKNVLLICNGDLICSHAIVEKCIISNRLGVSSPNAVADNHLGRLTVSECVIHQIRVVSNNYMILDRLCFNDCTFAQDGASYLGGFIGDVTFSDCAFIRSALTETDAQSGRCIIVDNTSGMQASSLTFSNCLFRKFGRIYSDLHASASALSNLRVENCTFDTCRFQMFGTNATTDVQVIGCVFKNLTGNSAIVSSVTNLLVVGNYFADYAEGASSLGFGNSTHSTVYGNQYKVV